MEASEMMVAVLIPLGFFLMVFGIIYMHKRENLAMIDKGLNPKEFANRPAPYRNLKWGLLLIGAGVGLLLAYILDTAVLPHNYNMLSNGIREYNNDPHVALYFALIAIGGGVGLVYSYKIEKKELLDKGK